MDVHLAESFSFLAAQHVVVIASLTTEIYGAFLMWNVYQVLLLVLITIVLDFRSAAI